MYWKYYKEENSKNSIKERYYPSCRDLKENLYYLFSKNFAKTILTKEKNYFRKLV